MDLKPYTAQISHWQLEQNRISRIPMESILREFVIGMFLELNIEDKDLFHQAFKVKNVYWAIKWKKETNAPFTHFCMECDKLGDPEYFDLIYNGLDFFNDPDLSDDEYCQACKDLMGEFVKIQTKFNLFKEANNG